MKFLTGIKQLFREPPAEVVYLNVIDMDRWKLKQFRKTQAHKYGLKPEDFRLYHRGDGKKEIVAYLEGTVFSVTQRGLKK